MRRNYSNTAVATTLASGIDAEAVSLQVADATGYPDAPFTIKIGSEVILVGAKTGTTFSTLTRGYDGTVAAAHDSGAGVEHVVVAEDVRRVPNPFAGYPFDDISSWRVLIPVTFTSSTTPWPATFTEVQFLFIDEPCKLTELAVKVEEAGSTDGQIDFALYRDKPLPSNYIQTICTIASGFDSTGVKRVTGLSIPLVPGRYWIMSRATGFAEPPKILGTNNGNPSVISAIAGKDQFAQNMRKAFPRITSFVSFTDFGLNWDGIPTSIFIELRLQEP